MGQFSVGGNKPEGCTYSNPLQTTVIIDSPRLQAYLGIIQELDNYIKLLDIAWFYGQINDKTRAQEIFKAKRIVVSVSTQIRQLWNRVYRAAHAKNVTVEVSADQSLTVITPEDAAESTSAKVNVDDILLDKSNIDASSAEEDSGADEKTSARKKKAA